MEVNNETKYCEYIFKKGVKQGCCCHNIGKKRDLL